LTKKHFYFNIQGLVSTIITPKQTTIIMQKYNLYLILNPKLSSENVGTELNKLQEILKTDINAQNITMDDEGLKRLSYPINKLTTGIYVDVNFDLDINDCAKLKILEQKINLMDNIIRSLNINVTDFLKQKVKEVLNKVEITNHRDLNTKAKEKKCISKFMGIREIDYKDQEYLRQFVSPYSKIFAREKTGTSAKFQRKIAQAVKRSRHMSLMSFTNIHNH
jgi:small subunit ribosomal protein S18